MPHSLKEIAQLIDGKIIGNENLSIESITNFENPLPNAITFVQDAKSLAKIEASEVTCIIVPSSIEQSKKSLIQVKNPKLAWAKLLEIFFPEPVLPKRISDQAIIAKTAQVGRDVTIEPFVHIAEGVSIGDGTVLRSHVFIGENVKIGKGCTVHSNAVVYRNSLIGDHVVIHAGSVIGSDGFGYVPTEQGQIKVPQVGNVILENHVEIGASVTIDRATIGSTHIGPGTKIDNLVQIGHNVTIGAHTVISSQTGISGSCKIGNFVTMGGKVGLGDHVEIGDFVMVGAGAGLPTGKKISAKQIIFGQPARPYREARKQIAAQLKSAEMLESLRDLKRRVDKLESQSSEKVSNS